jgi:hypothetical protein
MKKDKEVFVMTSEEPSTTADLVQDLLNIVLLVEWEYSRERCPRGCCDESKYRCSYCSVEQGNEHKDGCVWKDVTRRAQAFLQAEEEIRK